jgi:hypothetical protein
VAALGLIGLLGLEQDATLVIQGLEHEVTIGLLGFLRVLGLELDESLGILGLEPENF